MTKWGRKVEVTNTSEQWSAKKKQQDGDTLHSRLNALGAEGWALVPDDAVPMSGTFTPGLALRHELRDGQELSR